MSWKLEDQQFLGKNLPAPKTNRTVRPWKSKTFASDEFPFWHVSAYFRGASLLLALGSVVLDLLHQESKRISPQMLVKHGDLAW